MCSSGWPILQCEGSLERWFGATKSDTFNAAASPPHHQMYSMTSPWSLFGGYPNFLFPYRMPLQIANGNQQPLGYSPQAYPQQWGLPMPYATGSQGPVTPTPASHFQAQSSMIPRPSHVGALDVSLRKYLEGLFFELCSICCYFF